jgi:hypothetical protein
MSEKIKNARDVLHAINKIKQENGDVQSSLPASTTPQYPVRPVEVQKPTSSADIPSIEIEDQSDENEGTVFLLWYDNDDSQKFASGQQQGIYPMKSPLYLAKHIDFHNDEQRQNAIQEIASIAEMFENDSIEVRNRGKYAIVIGKMVKIEVKKHIILK